jgi:release factor glutamine methyltransferase
LLHALPTYIGDVTVLEVIQRSTEFLSKKGVESARLQAELLLAHLLKLKRLQLYLNFERPLTAAEVSASREAIRRRGQHEPVQYIVGSTSFCGLELEVNRAVLIPRPETELLAEQGWLFLQRASATDATALDFGTGSGCLAVALAVKCPRAKVTALEISPAALGLAAANATQHGVSERIRFVEGPGMEVLEEGLKFDLVISNPPYIPSAEIQQLQPEVRDFEPRGALDGGADGLEFYRQLATQAASRLAPGGRIMLEFGDGQAPAIEKLFRDQNWIVERILQDYTGRQRILIAKHG